MSKAIDQIQNHGWQITRELGGLDPDSREYIYFLGLALSGEVGELNNMLKKAWRGDKSLNDADFRREIKKEVADCFNYVVLLAGKMGIADIEAVALEKSHEVMRRHGLED